ncbi:YajG family lipoprotein [Seminibacterium arietis]|uniref:YajG family lipoprotein n=1 Tax=Seminibacterium arietis TaxID=1173502 RepID=A0ABW3I9H7_9PAST
MKFKKLFTIFLSLFSVLLSACQGETNSVLYFNPPSPINNFNPLNQNAILNIVVRDNRNKPEVSNYVSAGKNFNLYAQPQVAQLFDQVIKQDLNAKGFHIAATPVQANTNLIVNVNHFYANVEQGSLRHKITSSIQLNIQIQGVKGQFNKNIGGTRTVEGAFNAKNEKIQKVLSDTLNDVVRSIYQDQEIPNAINRYLN